MNNILAASFIRQILILKKRPYQGADRMFFDRVRRKINAGQQIDAGEENKLKDLFEMEQNK